MKYFPSKEVGRSRQGIYSYPMEICPRIEQNHRLDEDPEGVVVDKGRYQHLVRRWIYFSHTHPDIAYSLSVVSQVNACTSEFHICMWFTVSSVI